MDIDAQGRVWVTEAVNYRKLAGKDPDGDRVVVLEDTDGAGKADKSTCREASCREASLEADSKDQGHHIPRYLVSRHPGFIFISRYGYNLLRIT